MKLVITGLPDNDDEIAVDVVDKIAHLIGNGYREGIIAENDLDVYWKVTDE